MKKFIMSFFGKMFGRKKTEKVEVKATGEAIQELRDREEMLLKQQELEWRH